MQETSSSSSEQAGANSPSASSEEALTAAQVQEILSSLESLQSQARTHAERVAELETQAASVLENAKSSQIEAAEAAEAADTARQESQGDRNQIQTLRSNATSGVDDIGTYRQDALNALELVKQDQAKIKVLADAAQEKDSTVEEYKSELTQLTQQYEEIREKIDSLLPGATSASLASAFGRRKVEFASPKNRWFLLYVLSALAFIGVGLYVLVVHDDINSFSELIFFALKRSPILAGIILIEEFARRNYNIALRLEEDYGYKEVLSRSFEGYKKQMDEIADEKSTPVYQLSRNLLDALGQHPGRLIDKEKSLCSPSADMIDQLANLVSQRIKKEEQG
jgi:hypothetical protein